MHALELDLYIQQIPDLLVQTYVTFIAIVGFILGVGILRQLLKASKKRG
jgi:hypothetical protein